MIRSLRHRLYLQSPRWISGGSQRGFARPCWWRVSGQLACCTARMQAGQYSSCQIPAVVCTTSRPNKQSAGEKRKLGCADWRTQRRVRGGGGRAGMHVPEAVVQASTTLPCALNLCNSSADPSRRRVPVAHSCPKLPPPLNLLSHLHLMNQLLSVDPPPLCKSSRRCTPQLPRAAGHLLRHASPTAI